MQFRARVGILPEERSASQPIEVDLTVQVHPEAGVVDYRDLYECAATVLSSGHIDFLEEVGEQIAKAALSYSARVRRVRVAVRKPQVMLPGPLDHAEVVVERDAHAEAEAAPAGPLADA
jgi:7,8-dihydroneopterin aldolase/epimerase/oxygenase